MKIPDNPHLRLLLFSLLLFVATLVYSRIAPPKMVADLLLFIVPFFFLTTLFFRVVIHYILQKNAAKAKIYYLALSGAKFLLYIAVLITYGLIGREDVAAFFLSFLIFYLVYTFMDVKYMLRQSST